MNLILALILAALIIAIAWGAWYGMKVIDDRLMEQTISIHRWRRLTRTYGILLVTAIGLILMLAALYGGASERF